MRCARCTWHLAASHYELSAFSYSWYWSFCESQKSFCHEYDTAVHAGSFSSRTRPIFSFHPLTTRETACFLLILGCLPLLKTVTSMSHSTLISFHMLHSAAASRQWKQLQRRSPFFLLHSSWLPLITKNRVLCSFASSHSQPTLYLTLLGLHRFLTRVSAAPFLTTKEVQKVSPNLCISPIAKSKPICTLALLLSEPKLRPSACSTMTKQWPLMLFVCTSPDHHEKGLHLVCNVLPCWLLPVALLAHASLFFHVFSRARNFSSSTQTHPAHLWPVCTRPGDKKQKNAI